MTHGVAFSRLLCDVEFPFDFPSQRNVSSVCSYWRAVSAIDLFVLDNLPLKFCTCIVELFLNGGLTCLSQLLFLFKKKGQRKF